MEEISYECLIGNIVECKESVSRVLFAIGFVSAIFMAYKAVSNIYFFPKSRPNGVQSSTRFWISSFTALVSFCSYRIVPVRQVMNYDSTVFALSLLSLSFVMSYSSITITCYYIGKVCQSPIPKHIFIHVILVRCLLVCEFVVVLVILISNGRFPSVFSVATRFTDIFELYSLFSFIPVSTYIFVVDKSTSKYFTKLQMIMAKVVLILTSITVVLFFLAVIATNTSLYSIWYSFMGYGYLRGAIVLDRVRQSIWYCLVWLIVIFISILDSLKENQSDDISSNTDNSLFIDILTEPNGDSAF